MRSNTTNPYDIDSHVAEIYDQTETQLEDVDLLRQLIGKDRHFKILEPFCGSGRIIIPLAKDGHEVVGMDNAQSMLRRAQWKADSLSLELRRNISLVYADVLAKPWPSVFDLIVLGGNCFYELATADEQEKCIRLASLALKPGGFIFIDNDSKEGELPEEWRKTGTIQLSLLGVCQDGTSVESAREIIWADTASRLVKFRRWTKVILPNGKIVEKEFLQQKHPVSAGEIRGWLEKYGFVIENIFGDYHRRPFDNTSKRAIFWALNRYSPGYE